MNNFYKKIINGSIVEVGQQISEYGNGYIPISEEEFNLIMSKINNRPTEKLKRGFQYKLSEDYIWEQQPTD